MNAPDSPPPQLRLQAPLRFGAGGRFELRPGEYRLLVDGEPAALGGRALDVLFALAARRGELVTKQALFDEVWAGVVVEENNLRVQVNGLRRILGDDAIATVPGRGYRFTAPIADAPITLPPAAPHDAPVAMHLYGRTADRARIDAALNAAGGARVVTLVGPSGVGKSSLARAAAAAWQAAGGVTHWVDLAAIAREDDVAGAIGRALDIPLDAADSTALRLRNVPDGVRTLLVLDNAEHVLVAVATFVARVADTPSITLLLTSQAPAAVAGETVLRIEPLPVRADGASDDDAVALLCARIRDVDRRFTPGTEQRAQLAAIGRALDGLPLALEMAAARVPLMGVAAVHDALDERFALLARGRRDAPARHQRLRDALDWSYRLLTPVEQQLFRALGTFTGGFTLDLAVSLTQDEHVGRWDVVDGLATLVERSLVTVGNGDPPRYRLLESMRAYALDAQRQAGEHESLARRHAHAVLATFMRSAPDAGGVVEMENAQRAFRWAREHDLEVAAQLSWRVARVSMFSAWRHEVSEWMRGLEPAMRSAAGNALAAETQGNWWSSLAYVLNLRRNPAARDAAVRAVALWKTLAKPHALQAAYAHWVRSLHTPVPELDEACAGLQAVPGLDPHDPDVRLRVAGALAEAARVRDDPAQLLAQREEELAVTRAQGWTLYAQAAQCNVCAALVIAGRLREADAMAAALIDEIDAGDGDDNGNLPWALNARVEALVGLGRQAEARALVPRSLAAAQRFGLPQRRSSSSLAETEAHGTHLG